MPTPPAKKPASTATALLIVCPAAEPAVAGHRSRYDAAARVGVPAHLTVGIRSSPPDATSAGGGLDTADHQRLASLFAEMPAFGLTFSDVGWFGSDVLYLRPDDASPLVDLIHMVGRAFPDHPIYRGAFAEVVPHLTVAHGAPLGELTSVEAAVLPELPVSQCVSSIELWTGPALSSGLGTWRRVWRYSLGAPQRSPERMEIR